MGIINLSVVETLTTTYSAGTLLGDEPDHFGSTMTSLTSTATTSGSLGNNIVNITFAQNYIESMSDEQLEELVVKLDNKEMELDLKEDKPVVKVLSDKNKSI